MHDGEKKNFLTLLLLLLQIQGLLGLDTSGVAKEPKVIDLTLVLKINLYEYMDQITQTDPRCLVYVSSKSMARTSTQSRESLVLRLEPRLRSRF